MLGRGASLCTMATRGKMKLSEVWLFCAHSKLSFGLRCWGGREQGERGAVPENETARSEKATKGGKGTVKAQRYMVQMKKKL